jgi:peptidoglycan/xylan/chitin deacetylase (PgdA/CDA1 family)
MDEKIKSLAYRVSAFAGAPRLLQRIFASDGVAILMYHAVTTAPLPVEDWVFVEERHFREQMLYLKKHCHVIPLKDVPNAGGTSNGRPLVALTFDDGFQNNYSVAYPVLQSLGLPATIFLVTGLIDSDDTVWFCRINEALSRTTLTRLNWQGESYDLSTRGARAEAHALLQRRLKTFRHPELLERSADLIAALGDVPGRPIPCGSVYRMLTTHEIREMAATGLIEFGAHTRSHAILSRLPQAERTEEIASSLAAVEQLTGAPCRLFAYPNGRTLDYGPADVAVLRERNVTAAVTTVDGPNEASVSALEMRRYCIGAGTSLAQFKLLTHHVLWKLQH